MTSSSIRRVVPIREAFFCDGAWYVLSSSSLGGSGLSPAEIGEALQSGEPEPIRRLLEKGVCLPLYFPGDCALDNAVIIEGDLDEEEQEEWIVRVRSKLEIPCGEFMIMGGGLDEDFEVALPNAEAPDPHFVFFQKLKLTPGTYLVEVYGFLGSLNTNDEWEERGVDAEPFEAWWGRTRGSEPQPEWIEAFDEEDYVDAEEFEFLEYLIRLAPLTEDVQPPEQEDEVHWCAISEVRQPPLCPRGILRSKYGKLP